MADPNDLTVQANMKSLFLTFGSSDRLGSFLTGNEPWQLGLDSIEKLAVANNDNIKDTIRRMEKPPPIEVTAQDNTVTYKEQNLGQPTPYFLQYLRGLFDLSRYY